MRHKRVSPFAACGMGSWAEQLKNRKERSGIIDKRDGLFMIISRFQLIIKQLLPNKLLHKKLNNLLFMLDTFFGTDFVLSYLFKGLGF